MGKRANAKNKVKIVAENTLSRKEAQKQGDPLRLIMPPPRAEENRPKTVKRACIGEGAKHTETLSVDGLTEQAESLKGECAEASPVIPQPVQGPIHAEARTSSVQQAREWAKRNEIDHAFAVQVTL